MFLHVPQLQTTGLKEKGHNYLKWLRTERKVKSQAEKLKVVGDCSETSSAVDELKTYNALHLFLTLYLEYLLLT